MDQTSASIPDPGTVGATSRRRRWAIAGLLVGLLGSAVVGPSPTASAAPGMLKEIALPGACNGVAVAMAKAIDAKLIADKAAAADLILRPKGEPKAGEQGFVDVSVAFALDQLAKELKKDIGKLTVEDVTGAKNADAVKKVIGLALEHRKGLGGAVKAQVKWVDSDGNSVQLWCLLEGNGHSGPDLGLLYIPKGKAPKDGVWIGGCRFANGQNKYFVQYETDPVSGRDTTFVGFIFLNEQPVKPDDPKGAVERNTYVYDPVKDLLRIGKFQGSYNENKIHTVDPATVQIEKTPTPAPSTFEELENRAKKVKTSRLDGLAQPPVVALADDARPDSLAVTVSAADSSGGADDPELSLVVKPGEAVAASLPDGLAYAGSDDDPDWTVLSEYDHVIVLEYGGNDEQVLAPGEVLTTISVQPDLTAPTQIAESSPPPLPDQPGGDPVTAPGIGRVPG